MMNKFKMSIMGMDVTPVHAYSVSAQTVVKILIDNGYPVREYESTVSLLDTFYRDDCVIIDLPNNKYARARITRIL